MELTWLIAAQSFIGIRETRNGDNPDVLNFFRCVRWYDTARDEIPWCAAFVGAMLELSGIASTRSLMARSYEQWGAECEPKPGAIAVWPRGRNISLGHVNIVESVNGKRVTCVGGNQSDSVSRMTRNISEAVTFRWPLTNPVPMPVFDIAAAHAREVFE